MIPDRLDSLSHVGRQSSPPPRTRSSSPSDFNLPAHRSHPPKHVGWKSSAIKMTLQPGRSRWLKKRNDDTRKRVPGLSELSAQGAGSDEWGLVTNCLGTSVRSREEATACVRRSIPGRSRLNCIFRSATTRIATDRPSPQPFLLSPMPCEFRLVRLHSMGLHVGTVFSACADRAGAPAPVVR